MILRLHTKVEKIQGQAKINRQIHRGRDKSHGAVAAESLDILCQILQQADARLDKVVRCVGNQLEIRPLGATEGGDLRTSALGLGAINGVHELLIKGARCALVQLERRLHIIHGRHLGKFRRRFAAAASERNELKHAAHCANALGQVVQPEVEFLDERDANINHGKKSGGKQDKLALRALLSVFSLGREQGVGRAKQSLRALLRVEREPRQREHCAERHQHGRLQRWRRAAAMHKVDQQVDDGAGKQAAGQRGVGGRGVEAHVERETERGRVGRTRAQRRRVGRRSGGGGGQRIWGRRHARPTSR